MDRLLEVIKPSELKEQWTELRKEQIEKDANIIIAEFNNAVKRQKFHYLSNEQNKIIFYPANADYCNLEAFAEAGNKIIEAGWDISWGISYCAEGSFNAITIKGFTL